MSVNSIKTLSSRVSLRLNSKRYMKIIKIQEKIEKFSQFTVLHGENFHFYAICFKTMHGKRAAVKQTTVTT